MRIFIVILLILSSAISIAQVVFQPKQIDYNLKGVLYATERAYDFKFYNNGFSLGMSIGTIESYYKSSYYSIEFGTLKDFRERRQNKNVNIPSVGISSSFIYGKQNSIYMLKFGQGHKRYLTEKAKRKGLAVGYGLILALRKPYYVKIADLETQDQQNRIETTTERYTPENADRFLDYALILSGASFFEGFSNIRPTIGAHAKIGGHFAFGAFDKDDIKNKYAYINMYALFQFGQRN